MQGSMSKRGLWQLKLLMHVVSHALIKLACSSYLWFCVHLPVCSSLAHIPLPPPCPPPCPPPSLLVAVPVWLEYAKFAVEKMSLMLDGMEYPRDIFERGIVACGLHISQVLPVVVSCCRLFLIIRVVTLPISGWGVVECLQGV